MSRGVIPVYHVMADELLDALKLGTLMEPLPAARRSMQLAITAAKRLERGELIGFLERVIDRLQVTQSVTSTTT